MLNAISLEELFLTALELPTAVRPAFLDAHGADATLRAEVENLLQAAASANDFLEQPLAVLGSRTRVGEWAGEWKLLERIGQGGMGEVYRAERCDGFLRQQAAVKVSASGLHNPVSEERFRHEGQILAALDHPHIVRLLDGGILHDGSPYLVMEHIPGVPCADYLRSHDVTEAERLRLFCDLCGAVQHAHQRLMVHCDIKPSNVLVTEDGTICLLDFGAARDDRSAAQTAQTDLQPQSFTLNYCSPEQLRGERATVQSDVYCLGLLLYEMLADHKLRDFSQSTWTEALERMACEPDCRGLSNALRAIVRKAVRFEPSERYDCVQDLVRDVMQYRQGRPVLACMKLYAAQGRLADMPSGLTAHRPPSTIDERPASACIPDKRTKARVHALAHA